MKRVTIKDVARQAGVSTATVSHVINGTRHVEEKTKHSVRTAMRELGYQPNSLARSLRSGETKTIGLIIPDASNLFFADISRKIEDFGYENGYSVILCNSDNDLSKQRNYINTLIAKQVDGVIFISAGESNEDLLNLSISGIPVVVADRIVPLDLADIVLLNNVEAGYIAVKHLIDLGHRNIACITGPSGVNPSQSRVEGYYNALNEAGIAINHKLIIPGDFTFKGGVEAVEKLLNIKPRPSAVFILNDMMAIGAIFQARRMGLLVPENLSIFGFDDIEMASAITPSLTTMKQPIQELADIATSRLIEKMRSENNNWINEKIVLNAQLIIRESTAHLSN